MKLLVDSSVWIKNFAEEGDYAEYEKIIRGAQGNIFVTPLVLFEIKLVLLRLGKTPDVVGAALAFTKSLSTVTSLEERTALRAAAIKDKYERLARKGGLKANLSLADAVMVATAEESGATLLTADRNLKAVEEVKIITKEK